MKIDVTLDVHLASPLHIGSGARADSLADKPLVKDARGLPLIPGSSLRGKTRHACEQIARSLKLGPVCGAPYPDEMCRGAPPEQLCPVCSIFGSPWRASPLRFSNLALKLAPTLPQNPRLNWEARLEWTELRTGVGLSRAQRTAQEDILYTVETYRQTPALIYHGTIDGRLDTQGQAALLVAGLKSVHTLGGNRSRGLGGCRVTPIVYLDGVEQDLDALLKELKVWKN